MNEQLEMDFSERDLREFDPEYDGVWLKVAGGMTPESVLEQIDPEVARIFAQHCDDNGKLDYENYVLAVNKIFGFTFEEGMSRMVSSDLAKMEIDFLDRRAGDSMSPES